MRPVLLALSVLVAPAAAAQTSVEQFRAEVVPVLEHRGLACNGVAPAGVLALGTRAAALAGGTTGPAVKPGDPEGSLLLRMVTGDRPRMPRQAEPLTPAAVESVRRWIAGGAPWPDGLTLRYRKDPAGTWWSIRPRAGRAVPPGQPTAHPGPP